MDKLIELVNKKLNEYTKSISNPKLQEIIHYALLPGGKRLRPLLLLTILNDLNIDLEKGINQAIAVEMIHNYSLIHDDLPAMDNDDYRRGRLTVHKKYGESDAILAGDALLTDAFKYFALGDIDATKIIKIIILASNNAGSNGMVLGQVLDIDSNFKKLTLEEVSVIHYHKTRDLIHLAIKAGAIIAGLDDNLQNEIDKLANYFGIAFQIKDDLEDFADANSSDLENQKATYPSTIGKEESIKLLKEYKTKSLEICFNILGDNLFYNLIERILWLN